MHIVYIYTICMHVCYFTCIRPRKKDVVVPVTRPTSEKSSDLNIFFKSFFIAYASSLRLLYALALCQAVLVCIILKTSHIFSCLLLLPLEASAARGHNLISNFLDIVITQDDDTGQCFTGRKCGRIFLGITAEF